MANPTKSHQELLQWGRELAFDAATTWVDVLHRQYKFDLAKFQLAFETCTREALQEAFADAEQAWREGHDQLAAITFSASMQLAGIRAAKIAFGFQV